MLKATAFHLGRLYAKVPFFLRLAAFALLTWFVVSPFKPDRQSTQPRQIQAPISASPAPSASSPAERQAAERQRSRAECRASLATRKEEYAKAFKAGEYWHAALSLGTCPAELEEHELVKMLKEAEVKSHMADINGAKTSLRRKALAMEMLYRDYPDLGAKYKDQIPKVIAAAERQEKEEEARLKKSQGVSIGMSPEDVVGSSWGKPESINRTTTASGTREQWVYGGRNYLYFENGRLTSIQN